jgi:DNA-directed RNA polymerase specialized sigma24 family protein
LTPESFDQLLAFLHPDRDEAGNKYEAIRLRLIKIFTCRGCCVPEDLADETINRVARKVPEIAAAYTGDPALYFFGVANHVHMEYLRRKPVPVPPQQPDPSDDLEREFQCLEQCIEQLPPEHQKLIIEYHQDEKRTKIDRRKQLAERLDIGLNALRIQVCRIRASLQECVFRCLEQSPAG